MIFIGFKAEREDYEYLKELASKQYEGNISKAIRSHFKKTDLFEEIPKENDTN